MSFIRNRAMEGIAKGDVFIVSRTFTPSEIQAFADLSKDYNPVHFDERFTSAKGFDGPICHGLLVGSLLTEIGGQIGWLASVMAFRFRRPVYPGDTVTCAFTITDVNARGRAEAEAVWTNQHGAKVLEASLSGFLPSAADKAVMRAMTAEGDPTNPLRDE